MAAFSPGNIVVYRVGGTAEVVGGSSGAGSATLSSAANPVFLDEYTPAGVFVQSIALPTAMNGSQDSLTDSGTASSDGLISLSGDGQSILVAGYNTPAGTAGVANSTASTTGAANGNQRVIGVVSASGTVDTSTNVNGFASGGSARSAAAVNGGSGSQAYIGTNKGIALATEGSTSTPTTITTANTREVAVVNGQLFYSTGSGTAGIYTFGATLPTAAATATLLVASPGPEAFVFANVGGTGTAPDTLYVADDTNGIAKFSSTNGGASYTANGSVALAGATGITVKVANGTATIFATTPSGLYSLTDASAAVPLTGTPTLLAAAPSNTAFRGDVAQPTTACYGTGTLIRTARGDVAVEHLRVGDLVVTASGARRPIRWIGHRDVDCRHHPRPREAQPVRVAAHAFGTDRPARDLLVSPGHALCADVLGEVLIPAAALINGTTIVQQDIERVTYWHVELDGHDILLAENMPAESYLDMGNRGFFLEAAVVDLAASPDAPAARHADFCRPFHREGPVVAVVRAQLARRAKDLGRRLEAPLGRVAPAA